jgi:hypothetical protein
MFGKWSYINLLITLPFEWLNSLSKFPGHTTLPDDTLPPYRDHPKKGERERKTALLVIKEDAFSQNRGQFWVFVLMLKRTKRTF